MGEDAVTPTPAGEGRAEGGRARPSAPLPRGAAEPPERRTARLKPPTEVSAATGAGTPATATARTPTLRHAPRAGMAGPPPSPPAPAHTPPPAGAPSPFQSQLLADFPHVAAASPRTGADYLRQRGPLGERLLTLAALARHATDWPSWMELTPAGVIWLRYPEAFAVGGGEAPTRRTLSATDLFTKNPTKAPSAIHDRQGHPSVRLENKAAFHWVACACEPLPPGAQAGTAAGTPTPHPAPPPSAPPGKPTPDPGPAAPQAAKPPRAPSGPPASTPEPITPPTTAQAPVPPAAVPDHHLPPPAPASEPRPPEPSAAPDPAREELAAPAPSPFRSPLAHTDAPPAATPDVTPRRSLAPPVTMDPFIARLLSLAERSPPVAGLTFQTGYCELQEDHKAALATALALKSRELDYILQRVARTQPGATGILYQIPLPHPPAATPFPGKRG